jgi:hypothetical protein
MTKNSETFTMIVLTLVGLEKVWGLVADRVEISTSRGSLA